MKKIACVFLILLLAALTACAVAEVAASSDEAVFQYAVGLLRQVNDPGSVTDAEEVFGNITSGYGSANLYQVYCQGVLSIHDGKLDEAELRFQLLEAYPDFTASLEANALPLCREMLTYIEARRAENEGRVLDAMNLYRSITLLDSVQRSVNLVENWREELYAQACAMFDAQNYEQAAQLFEQLGNYGDSREKARQARALMPSAEPEPVVTAPPAPAPEPTPEIRSGTLAKGDKGDAVLTLQKRLHLLGFYDDKLDGIYGGKTQSAIKRFQQAAGLPETGTADSATQERLYAEDAPRTEMALVTVPPATPTPLPVLLPEPEPTPERTVRPTPTPVPAPTRVPTLKPTQAPEGASAAAADAAVVDERSAAQAIAAVQQALAEIALLPQAAVTGVYDANTRAAVADFQRWVNDTRQEQTLQVTGAADEMTRAYLEYCQSKGIRPEIVNHGTPAQPTEAPIPGSALAAGVPAPSGDFYYLDEVGVLSDALKGEIYFSNQLLNATCGAQLVVVVVNTTGDMSISDYGIEMFNTWGIGDRAKENGFLLLLAIQDDNYYAVSGKGLDALITSETLTDMFNQYLEPDFAIRRYGDGVQKFYEVLFERVSGYFHAGVTVQDGITAYQRYASGQ